MRRYRALFLVLVLSTLIGSHNVKASGGCLLTTCGFACYVWGPFAGYCSKLAEPPTGCIQLYGPDCASMNGAACCAGGGGGGEEGAF